MKATEYERQNTVLRAENAALREQVATAEQIRQKDVADAINKAVQIIEHQERAIEREGAAGLWRLVRCSDAIRALLKENGND